MITRSLSIPKGIGVNIIKKISVLAFSAFLVSASLFVSGCQKTNEDVIRESIIERFEPYKNMNENVIWRLSQTAEDEGLPEMGISGEEFAYAVLEGFDYSIGKIEVSNKDASAHVTITSKSLNNLLERLRATNSNFDDLKDQNTTQEAKTDEIHEIIMQAIRDTEVIEETVILNFSLNGTEWNSDNATEALGKLNSVIFAS